MGVENQKFEFEESIEQLKGSFGVMLDGKLCQIPVNKENIRNEVQKFRLLDIYHTFKVA